MVFSKLMAFCIPYSVIVGRMFTVIIGWEIEKIFVMNAVWPLMYIWESG